MSLTLFNRIEIDIESCFSAVSLGFNIHKRGFQISFIFLDISVYYFSPKQRALIEERYHRYIEESGRYDHYLEDQA